jgi:ankyrin repeat protein
VKLKDNLISCHKKCLEELAKKSLLINMEDKQGQTPLLAAIGFESDKWIIELLIQNIRNADLNAQENENHLTALIIAIRNNHFEMTRILIEHGSNINLTDKYGNSALMIAVKCIKSRSLLDIMKILCENKADVNMQNQDGNTALLLISDQGWFEGSLEAVKYLIEQGADFNLKNKKGETLLHLACCGGKTEMVHYLMEKGPDLNNQDSEGKTSLMISLERHYFLLAEMITERSDDLDVADVFHVYHNMEDKQGQTPLLAAIEFESDKWIIELLIQNRAYMFQMNKRGQTALCLAIKNGDIVHITNNGCLIF